MLLSNSTTAAATSTTGNDDDDDQKDNDTQTTFERTEENWLFPTCSRAVNLPDKLRTLLFFSVSMSY